MFDNNYLKNLENIALLLENHCFQADSKHFIDAEYEIRSLSFINGLGKSILAFGDKSGIFRVYNRRNLDTPIINEKFEGTIDLISHQFIPKENLILLFIGVRYKGIYEYHLKIEKEEIIKKPYKHIIEEKKFIPFLFPNFIYDQEYLLKAELWICYENGNFQLITCKEFGEKWEKEKEFTLPYIIRRYTVDRSETLQGGNLFLGNSAGDIFYLPFDRNNPLKFPDKDVLEKRKILTANGAFIDDMIPLSDYKTFSSVDDNYKFAYPEYSGCLVKSDCKIICIYFKKDDKKLVSNCKDLKVWTVTKEFSVKLLAIGSFFFNNFCYTVVSDVENRLHLIKNKTDMVPMGVGIEVILDGEAYTLQLNDRVISFDLVPVKIKGSTENEANYQVFLGMGNHCVQIYKIYNYEAKLEKYKKNFLETVCPQVDEKKYHKLSDENKRKILNSIEFLLDHFRNHESKTAVKKLILNIILYLVEIIGGMIENNGSFLNKYKDCFIRIFYKIIDDEDKELILKFSSFLTRLEKNSQYFSETITKLQTHVNKYVLDKKSYSKKTDKVKELWHYNENSGNLSDALVYKGILYDREYDPVSEIEFKEGDGEITRVVPLEDKFIVCTSKGKVFCAKLDENKIEKKLIFEYLDSNDNELEVKISNIYCGQNKIFLLVRKAEILVFNKEHLLSFSNQGSNSCENKIEYETKLEMPNQKNYGTSVCRMPWHDRIDSKADECLIGTNRGDIFYTDAFGKLKQLIEEKNDHFPILDLRSFILEDRHFVVAAFWNGVVKIFECYHNEEIDRNCKMDHKFSIQVDVHAVNRLHVFFTGDDSNFNKYPLIVAGTDSGKCYGIRLRVDEKNPMRIYHVFEWCYSSTEAIKGIHPCDLGESGNYILISTMDKHLHILKRNGISINTIQLNSPLIFVYVPGGQHKNRNYVEFKDAYATTVDNKLKKIRFFIKEKILEDINECFEGNRVKYEVYKKFHQEELLLKFKTIDITEQHFKVRYYLKSEMFNSVEKILNEIDEIITRANFNKEGSALLALIRRLFYEYMDTFLNDTAIFGRVRQLFARTCDHWDYEGSDNNIKVQLYWIRSLLKGCMKSGNPIEKINQWYKNGTCNNDLEPDSKEILEHFIMHSNPFLRVKSLQYINRFIINPEIRYEKTNFKEEIVKFSIESIIKVLKMHCAEAIEGGPSWFELEAVRFFSWIVVNYKYTFICPSRLCYCLWENYIPPTFFSRLADAVLICNERIIRRSEISDLFRAAGKLVMELKRYKPRLNGIFLSITKFCETCCENKNSSCTQIREDSFCNQFNSEFLCFFNSSSVLLEFDKIDKFQSINSLNNFSNIASNKFFRVNDIFSAFKELAEGMKKYFHEKYEDIYSLNKLQYSTFYNIIKLLQQINEMVEKPDGKYLWVEKKFYSFVLKQWDSMIREEMDNNIILDFAQAIREYNKQCTEYSETMDMPLIFKNIFTRLNIMAECDYSYLLYLDKDNKEINIIFNDKENKQKLNSKHKLLEHIPRKWLEPDIFASLGEDDLNNKFKSVKMMPLIIKTPGIDLLNTSAVFLFFWDGNKGESQGMARLEGREVLGEFITTMAYLQWAMLNQKEKQEEFFRIVSHELNQMIRGLLAWITNFLTRRLENDSEKRYEYYKRFNYSLNNCDHIIRSILSFRDNARVELQITDLKEEMDKLVKLARIQYKEYGNVQLQYTPPEGDFEIITDPALVGIAVMNLLNNAMKYDPNRNQVNLSLSVDGNKFIIEVTDEGVGIPKNEYDIIFKKFERGSFPRKNDIGGLGIGLAASKINIELLGGTITFESKVGKGSTFKIILNKHAFLKSHLLTTHVYVKRSPDFFAIEDLEIREKILERIEYNPYKKRLRLRGGLTYEQYIYLRDCFKFKPDEKRSDDFNERERQISQFNMEKIEKLYLDAKKKLERIKSV